MSYATLLYFAFLCQFFYFRSFPCVSLFACPKSLVLELVVWRLTGCSPLQPRQLLCHLQRRRPLTQKLSLRRSRRRLLL
jgi:hypothetical protein